MISSLPKSRALLPLEKFVSGMTWLSSHGGEIVKLFGLNQLFTATARYPETLTLEDRFADHSDLPLQNVFLSRPF